MTSICIESVFPQKQIGLIHKIYQSELKNAREYKASTKTKSEVRGGGRKPWKQKGTGNARAGSSRSPLWVGGGVSFGPKPRIVIKKINKKERAAALNSIFYLKRKRIRIINLPIPNKTNFVQTKRLMRFISGDEATLSCTKRRILLILEHPSQALWLAARNLKGVQVTLRACLTIRQILHADLLFMEPITYSNLLKFMPLCVV